jgi:hypothetical protein
MTIHRYTLAMLWVVLVATACARQESNYCATAPHHNCLDLDGGIACRSDQDCTGAAAVCDVDGSKTCVQCTATRPEACGATTPVCGADDMCRRCTAHADCGSQVCLPDGSCAVEASVAYVAPGGSGTACTKTAPCGTLDDGVKRNVPNVKLAMGLVKDNKTTTIDGQAVAIFAESGARLDRDGDGPVIQVQSNGADVKVFDLEITGATGTAGGDGIDLAPNGGNPKLTITRVTIGGNQGFGISASGGTLAISQSTVSGNTGGGISVTGASSTFDITNSFITYNGVATGPGATQVGGASLLPNTAGSKFERNTVAFNQSDGAIFRGGVTCTGTMVSAIGNIVYRNTEGANTSNATQLGGSCQFGNTLALGSVPGDLGFKSPLTSPFDLHLTAASPASVVDAAGACTGVDLDGDPRPIGNACDLGADERKP